MSEIMCRLGASPTLFLRGWADIWYQPLVVVTWKLSRHEETVLKDIEVIDGGAYLLASRIYA